MKTKKIPLRSCVVSKEKLPKQELIRVVKNKENEVFIDLTGKANGKGAYIKKRPSHLRKSYQIQSPRKTSWNKNRKQYIWRIENYYK